MKMFQATELACPHCSTKNQLSGIRVPKDFEMHQTIIKCWNEPNGCMKEFAVNVKTQIFTSLTKDQVVEKMVHDQKLKEQQGANPN